MNETKQDLSLCLNQVSRWTWLSLPKCCQREYRFVIANLFCKFAYLFSDFFVDLEPTSDIVEARHLVLKALSFIISVTHNLYEEYNTVSSIANSCLSRSYTFHVRSFTSGYLLIQNESAAANVLPWGLRLSVGAAPPWTNAFARVFRIRARSSALDAACLLWQPSEPLALFSPGGQSAIHQERRGPGRLYQCSGSRRIRTDSRKRSYGRRKHPVPAKRQQQNVSNLSQ